LIVVAFWLHLLAKQKVEKKIRQSKRAMTSIGERSIVLTSASTGMIRTQGEASTVASQAEIEGMAEARRNDPGVSVASGG